ncbi:MAG: hypothetical protein KA035_01405 [Candidatus Levybacteria bacterium]|nr:hypothetical protein [Candidatus Levybacteria bacterium]
MDARAEMMGHRIGEHVAPRVRKAQEVGGSIAQQAAARSKHRLGEWGEAIKNRTRNAKDWVTSTPSKEFEGYSGLLLSGQHEDLKFDPSKVMPFMEDFGGNEGRLSLFQGRIEMSFIVHKTPDGAWEVVPEHVVEFDGKI